MNFPQADHLVGGLEEEMKKVGSIVCNCPIALFGEDEDRLLDDWFEAAEAAARRGEPSLFNLSAEELDRLVNSVDNDDAEPTDGSVEDDDDDSVVDELNVFDDEYEPNELDREETCGHCGGSRFQSGGDGAQCDECLGSGTVSVN